MSDSRDENLLFGILALQLDFINQEQLVEAANKWMVAKSSHLGEILVKQGAITESDCDFIRSIVNKHVARSGSPKSSIELLKQHVPISDANDKIQTIFEGGTAEDAHAFSADGTTIWIPGSSEHESRFVRLRHLARGGLGVVSVARDQELEREVALKELSDRKRSSNDAYERFVAEAKITGNLEHPGIVPIYGLGVREDGSPYYAMRLIRGKNLQEEIALLHGGDNGARAGMKFSQLDVEHLRKLLRSLGMACNAVAYAHSRGVIHRDLKPGNIMLGKFGETIVVDWGLAKAKGAANDSMLRSEAPVHDSRESSGSATVRGSVLGTHGYMSPEQASGQMDLVDHRSDVFGLGACLYSMLTDRVPFKGNTKEESLENARSYKLARLRELDSQIPLALEAVCLKAMAAKPADRYQNATELADDIDRWIAGEAVTAMPDPLLQRMFRWARQHQTLVTSTAVLLITTIVGLLIASVLINEQRNIARQERDRANDTAEQLAQEVKLKNAALEKSEASTLESLKIIEQFVKNLADDGWANVPNMESERIEMVDTAVKCFQRLLEEDPGDLTIQKSAARILIRSANVYRMVGNLDSASERFGEALTLIETMGKDGSLQESLLDLTCDALYDYTNLVEVQLGSIAALAYCKQGIEVCRKRQTQSPDSPSVQLDLMKALTQSGSLERDVGLFEEATRDSAEAVKLFPSVAKAAPKFGVLHAYPITALDTQAKVLIEQGKLEEAAVKVEELAAACTVAAEKFPDDINAVFFSLQAVDTLGRLAIAKGDFDLGIAKLQEYIEQVKLVSSKFEDTADYKEELLRAQADAGLFALKAGNISLAKEFLQECMKKIDIAKPNADSPVVELKSHLRPLALAYLLARRDGSIPSELSSVFNSFREKVKERDANCTFLRELDLLLISPL